MIERHQNIFEYIKINFNRESKILDIGCDKGHLLNELLENGYKSLDCVDIKDSRDYQKVKELCSFHQLDFNKSNLPLGDNSLDIVCALQIFEHLENPHHFKRECCRVLKPGGKLIISIPHGHNLASKLRFLLRGNVCRFEKNNEHITFLTRNVFYKIFAKDFKLVRKSYTRGYLSDFGLRFYTPNTLFFNKWFGRNAYYFLEKK
ncbi:MAG: class I SAM-dependent methyltransferase [Parcubacteria group bacterium]|nr:class I SAM-dependent methyltransferase [Parcubacteria group bacterium]